MIVLMKGQEETVGYGTLIYLKKGLKICALYHVFCITLVIYCVLQFNGLIMFTLYRL